MKYEPSISFCFRLFFVNFENSDFVVYYMHISFPPILKGKPFNFYKIYTCYSVL